MKLGAEAVRPWPPLNNSEQASVKEFHLLFPKENISSFIMVDSKKTNVPCATKLSATESAFLAPVML